MIRRETEGDFLLISQMAHAHLAAQLAAHFGNRAFAPYAARSDGLTAIELHDAGWPTHDDAPSVNHHGKPTDVFEMPMEKSLHIWSLSTQRAMEANPYAGLLVSLHGLALSSRIKSERPTRAAAFALIKFQHQQVEIQESMRKKLDLRTDLPLRNGLAELGRSASEDALLYDFRVLEFVDQLSLNLCFDAAKIPSSGSVCARLGAMPVICRIRREEDEAFVVQPWPFHAETLELEIPCRRIAARRYTGAADLLHGIEAGEEFAVTSRLKRRS
jgi:hypothetical protein